MSLSWLIPRSGDPAVLVTGAAGFIGYHVAMRLLEAGQRVVGIDDLNGYYDVRLKRARLASLESSADFSFIEGDICDRAVLRSAFASHRFRKVVHFAAQAGVRHSLNDPYPYAETNVVGFLNLIEECRRSGVDHLVYASSSSVYGGNASLPFSPHDSVDHPVSLYAATKKSNELMAHAYAHLFDVPATGLRFFTIYGPWGRPDMAYWTFADAIAAGETIKVFNYGDMGRDFTYIDDAVEMIDRVLAKPPSRDAAFDAHAPDPATSWAPHRIYNVAAGRPERLTRLITVLEDALGVRAERHLLPMEPGDVPETWADVSDLENLIGPIQRTPLTEGVTRFVSWRSWWREQCDYPAAALRKAP